MAIVARASGEIAMHAEQDAVELVSAQAGTSEQPALNSETTLNISDAERDRFWSKVDRNGQIVRPELGECWTWRGGHTGRGYSSFTLRGRQVLAHRLSLAIKLGGLPADMRACHHCDNPGCVNPKHLFAGTATDNSRDMVEKGRLVSAQRSKTHCPKGHPYSGDNLRERVRSTGHRERTCRTCKKARCKAYWPKWAAKNRPSRSARK